MQDALHQEWRDLTKGCEELHEELQRSSREMQRLAEARTNLHADMELKQIYLQIEQEVFEIQARWREYGADDASWNSQPQLQSQAQENPYQQQQQAAQVSTQVPYSHQMTGPDGHLGTPQGGQCGFPQPGAHP